MASSSESADEDDHLIRFFVVVCSVVWLVGWLVGFLFVCLFSLLLMLLLQCWRVKKRPAKDEELFGVG